MKSIQSLLMGVVLLSCGSALATEVFLLNKTPKPFYYRVAYHNVGQDLLSIPAAGFKDPKTAQWFEEQLAPKFGEGILAPNEVAHVKSYRLKYIVVNETKPESLISRVMTPYGDVMGPRGQIVSFSGDKRIRDACQIHKASDCLGSTMKDINPALAQGYDPATMKNYSQGYLTFQQKGLTNLAVPVVLVVTLDPVLESQGKVGYVLTELAHTWGLVRTPKSFFYELRTMQVPETQK